MRSLCFLSRNVGGTHFPLGSYLNDWLDLGREEECGGQNNDSPHQRCPHPHPGISVNVSGYVAKGIKPGGGIKIANQLTLK